MDKAGFYYDYCVDHTFWTKTCKKWKTDFWDINNKADRMELINTGFKLVVKRL